MGDCTARSQKPQVQYQGFVFATYDLSSPVRVKREEGSVGSNLKPCCERVHMIPGAYLMCP